jgi:hypothetical protein
VNRWLFSARLDLLVFGGTAIAALLLVALGPSIGLGPSSPADAPEWSWVTGVLLVDVAHVWSTMFVVYLDPVEYRRRSELYLAVPVAAYIAGVALYAIGGEDWFWRVIAYLAVFHFIRQQYGWVMMYRARNGERDRVGRWLDGATIYMATIYPLVWWHAQLPRQFQWMKKGDFVGGVPAWLADACGVVYLALLAIYVARAVVARPIAWGKHLVVAATAACWYVGIVGTNSDYAFTVTNVFVHGIPYMVLVYIYARAATREAGATAGASARLLRHGWIAFLGTLWLIAYVEELVWNKTLDHDHSYLFGGGIDVGVLAILIAPLLAVPQLTHYVLDGLLWRRSANPRLGRLLTPS